MLQSEFFERTKVQLTGEEYAAVECLYNAVKMDKNEFCKRWVSVRNNPLFKELAEAFNTNYSMRIAEANELNEVCQKLRKEIDTIKTSHNELIESVNEEWRKAAVNFAKKIIIANEESKEKVYDIIEEEYSIASIIRTKREADIPLSESEIDYMVSKL